MQESDFQRFKEIMVGMGKLYEREVDSPLLDAYWLALRNWSLEEFIEAAAHLMGNSEFMPRPAAFNELRKAGRPTSGEAWARAVMNCGSCHSSQGYTNGGSCGDPFIDRVVRAIGGYKTIAMSDSDKLHFLERRFAEHFETMQEAADIRGDVPMIAFKSRPMIEGPRSLGDIAGELEEEWH